MVKSRGMLIVVSGPSGVGKDSVVSGFLRKDLSNNYRLSISATTRSPRPGEEDGKDYYFVTRDEFTRKIELGEMLEYAEYGGNFYGTLKAETERELELGRNLILVIEVQGAAKIRALCPEAVLVFMLPPSVESLRQRLALRGTETSESLNIRLDCAREEMTHAGNYDYIIVNNELEKSILAFRTILTAAAYSPRHIPEITLVPSFNKGDYTSC